MQILKNVALSLSLTALLSANAMGAVTLGKAAELACHRLEKLVALGKAEESFITKFSSLQISKLQPSRPADPAFKVTISQHAGVDGSSKQIDIMLDVNGKGIAQVVKDGPEASNAPVWSDKDALTLVEYALHHVSDSNDADLKPFLNGLTILKLKQMKNDNGISARVVMNSKETTKTLEVNLYENGAVESTNSIIAE
jgi:hypothetical protein